MQKRAAIALIVGSIMFMGSVFLPAIIGQFQATTAEEIVTLILFILITDSETTR